MPRQGRFPFYFADPPAGCAPSAPAAASSTKCSETQLPPREAFNSTLYIRLSEEEFASEKAKWEDCLKRTERRAEEKDVAKRQKLIGMDEFQAAQRRWGYYEAIYKVGRISEEDYKKEQTKWDEFHCETLSDYVDLYCSQDTLLLADTFETFRD